jgi:penicillin-binding protein 1A
MERKEPSFSKPGKKSTKPKASTDNRLYNYDKQPKASWRKALLKWLIKWGFIASIWIGSAATIMLIYYATDLPDTSKLEQLKKQRKITILAENNIVLTNFGDLYGEYVPYNKLPKHLINAVLATEDRRFFDHFGIDIVGLVRAAYTNYRAKRVVQGGSTISQQLAKIVFLDSKRTMKRKAQEVILALYLEQKFTKEQILTIYLNRVYLGSGIYGVGAAAKYYFNKSIKDLTLYEAAIIAGLLKAPSKYAPTNNLDLSGRRAYQILLNMQDAGMITAEEVKEAETRPVLLETSAMGELKNLYFANWIKDQVDAVIEDTESDLVVKTTLNINLQKQAEESVETILARDGKKLNISQGAMVVLSPQGKVLAMVGGRSYDKSPFNRAVQAYRQPGSAFKYFVYMAALDRGYKPSTIVNDSPVYMRKWQPKNYTRQHLGDMTLRDAFAKSINTVAVKTSEAIGRDKVVRMAKHLGISSKLESHPSIALGSVEVNLLELTGAYAVTANNGYRVFPYGIKEIRTGDGKVLFAHPNMEQEKIISNETVENMLELLRSTIDYGTGKAARLSVLAYGKTGTTQDFRDAWFIGFAKNLVASVWVGNDNNSHMKRVTGGGVPALIWQDFMSHEVGGAPKYETPQDDDLIFEEVLKGLDN